ncbi:MAG: hypothetical protein GWN67_24305, partial [Phycisphaerae bacterium]|nr:hypothetical protein [Gammaproteobacteria bacterium]NIQ75455.1 hypothetical protein [Gammaproteobacteria bacterium]NIU59389.1 hypothetical protein [Phycisphaerae bacterium]
APFTALGAVTGIIIMAIIVFGKVPAEISHIVFYSLHPIHIVASAIATTGMYQKYGGGKIWTAILVGYAGSIGIATLSDALIPHLGGVLLGIKMEFHIPFIEIAKMPVIGIAKWQIVNSAALAGIIVGYLRPTTKIPHLGHVLLSTWASLFYFTAFGTAWWIPLFPFIFLFLFLAVWIPCCTSDILFPLLFTGKAQASFHYEPH